MSLKDDILKEFEGVFTAMSPFGAMGLNENATPNKLKQFLSIKLAEAEKRAVKRYDDAVIRIMTETDVENREIRTWLAVSVTGRNEMLKEFGIEEEGC